MFYVCIVQDLEWKCDFVLIKILDVGNKPFIVLSVVRKFPNWHTNFPSSDCTATIPIMIWKKNAEADKKYNYKVGLYVT